VVGRRSISRARRFLLLPSPGAEIFWRHSRSTAGRERPGQARRKQAGGQPQGGGRKNGPLTRGVNGTTEPPQTAFQERARSCSGGGGTSLWAKPRAHAARSASKANPAGMFGRQHGRRISRKESSPHHFRLQPLGPGFSQGSVYQQGTSGIPCRRAAWQETRDFRGVTGTMSTALPAEQDLQTGENQKAGRSDNLRTGITPRQKSYPPIGDSQLSRVTEGTQRWK